MTKYFKEIEDTRQQGKVKYTLVEVIVITIAAVTARNCNVLQIKGGYISAGIMSEA